MKAGKPIVRVCLTSIAR